MSKTMSLEGYRVYDLAEVDRLLKKKPKRPLSAYNLFFAIERQRLIQERLDAEMEGSSIKGKSSRRPRTRRIIKFDELGRIVGRNWKTISKARREELEEQAKIFKAAYYRAMDDWKRSKKILEERIMAQSNSERAEAMETPETSHETFNTGGNQQEGSLPIIDTVADQSLNKERHEESPKYQSEDTNGYDPGSIKNCERDDTSIKKIQKLGVDVLPSRALQGGASVRPKTLQPLRQECGLDTEETTSIIGTSLKWPRAYPNLQTQKTEMEAPFMPKPIGPKCMVAAKTVKPRLSSLESIIMPLPDKVIQEMEPSSAPMLHIKEEEMKNFGTPIKEDFEQLASSLQHNDSLDLFIKMFRPKFG